MSENRDPKMKLFGKTIQLGSNIDAYYNDDIIIASKLEPSATNVSATKFDLDCHSESTCSSQNFNRVNEDPILEESVDAEQEGEQSLDSSFEEPKTLSSRSNNEENLKTLTKDKLSSSENLPKNDQEQSDHTSSNSESSDQNSVKKPDKTVPCARCSSIDTKFCYFNNYNVYQPRCFCKNCQRYWTSGGSMRNVPVGAGSRKSKNSLASQHHQLVIPGASDGLLDQVMRLDGTVLTFGPENSLSNEPKASDFKVGEGTHSFRPNGVLAVECEKKSQVSSSNSSSISIEKNGISDGGIQSCQVVLSQCGEKSAAPWNMNWVPTPLMISDQSSTNSSPNSTSLGKHSRESWTLMSPSTNKIELSKEKVKNSRVIIPKTLRVDDPLEAAKSSIWTTPRINQDHIGSSSGRAAFFGVLQQAKGVPYERRNINQNVEASSMVLQANPAAFSRSLSFHEVAQ